MHRAADVYTNVRLLYTWDTFIVFVVQILIVGFFFRAHVRKSTVIHRLPYRIRTINVRHETNAATTICPVLLINDRLLLIETQFETKFRNE